ncbi:SDR family NAD(P)-dependent oxidoreductase [Roseovarius salis]|uniref:SDR family oxidoreductase n=1 Tax=Roseovarius salis TaxID=3376063 RepID=UPI0037C788FB
MTTPGRNNYVIVSGASKGIGRQCATALTEAGFHVLAGIRGQSDADALNGLGNSMLHPVMLDITRPDQIAALVSRCEGLDIRGLVNNAGTAVLGPVEFLPLDDIRQEFEVNLFGHVAMIQAFLPKLRAAKGRIINISSISGFVGLPYFGAYSASKFAIEGLSDALRRELKPTGVAVSVVQPGNMDTAIWDKSYNKAKALEGDFPDHAQRIYGKRFHRNADGRHGPLHKDPPGIVATAVVRAMTDARPKSRYLAGKDARRFSRRTRFLPDALLDRIFRA